MSAQNRQASQYADLVRVHLRNNRFLDRDTEMRLLEEGITRYDLSLAEASAMLRGSAEDAEAVSESELDQSTRQLLRTLSDGRGRLRREDFEKAAAFYRGRAGSAVTPEEARSRVKRLMEENDIQPRRAGRLLRTRRWYRAIET